MMAKFREKPVVIDAITFDEMVAYGVAAGANIVDGVPWSFDFITKRTHHDGRVEKLAHPITHETDECYLIPTLEGTHKMTRDDMLITGVNGEIYPCKIDVFEKTYERI